MNKPFYITTAIDYVNGLPHLGHAYEKVLADVMARSRRSLGQPVFFLTGLDEHGQKVQQAALADGKAPQTHCDELTVAWRAFAHTIGVSHDDFVRTTEPRHHEMVQAVLQRLFDGGHLYRSTHTGFYSTKEETFLTEKDRRPDGTFDPAYGDVVEVSEDNYYFKLRHHQAWLLEHIERHPEFIYPEHRRNEVLGLLRHNVLEDLCITRPKERLAWGIPVPFDPAFVTYVWFDALLNYITVPASHGDPAVRAAAGLAPAATGSGNNPATLWPADVHLIGKDIIKFHAVYWPVMLRVLGLPLPRRILAHGWWQKDNRKMSKSEGNIVDPMAVAAEWGVDAFRYYVLRELDLGPDGNWTDAGFKARYQAELANGLGNLVNRSLSMLQRYRQGKVPPRADAMAGHARAAADTALRALDAHELQTALVAIWGLVSEANRYVDQTAPFKIAKDPARSQELDGILYSLAETCRVLAVLLWPFLPGTATRIYAQLGLAGAPNQWSASHWGGLEPGSSLGPIEPLFPRKD